MSLCLLHIHCCPAQHLLGTASLQTTLWSANNMSILYRYVHAAVASSAESSATFPSTSVPHFLMHPCCAVMQPKVGDELLALQCNFVSGTLCPPCLHVSPLKSCQYRCCYNITFLRTLVPRVRAGCNSQSALSREQAHKAVSCHVDIMQCSAHQP